MILSDEERLARKELVQKNREKRALALIEPDPIVVSNTIRLCVEK